MKDILGANTSLCFQLCVGVIKHISNAEEFDAAAGQIGADFSKHNNFNQPQDTPQSKIFSPGFLYKKGNMRIGHIVTVQPLLTLPSYSLVGDDPDKSSASIDARKYAQAYISEIESCYPNLQFSGKMYADSEKLDVDFKYIVAVYEPALCHPAELGVLKPITIIGDKIIQPQSTLVQGDQPSTPKPRP